MDEAKRKKLEDAGWKLGTVAEFLGLTPEESDQIEAKLRAEQAEVALRNQRSYLRR